MKREEKHRVLTDVELDAGLLTWRMEDHQPGTLEFLVALALNTARVDRERIKDLESAIRNAECALAEGRVE